MKILKNNYTNNNYIQEMSTKSNPRKHICENCESELEYEESDMRMGFAGCMHLDCPLCGYENMLEENENSITLKKDNIKFPTHFWRFCKDAGSVEISSHEIENYIRRGIDYFRENKNEYCWYSGSGDSRIFIFKYAEDKSYEILVAKDFYEVEIPFNENDY